VNKYGSFKTVKLNAGISAIIYSYIASDGSISYLAPVVFSFSPTFHLNNFKSAMGGSSLLDFDGDGYNDIISPYYAETSESQNREEFYVISGSDVVKGQGGSAILLTVPLKAAWKSPLFVIEDVL